MKKIQKWQEPPPTKKKKALAAPLQEIRKKRGGKRKRLLPVCLSLLYRFIKTHPCSLLSRTHEHSFSRTL